MNWAKAIETNQAALIRIVAALFAMAGLHGSGALARLPQPLYRAVSRVLHPVESAVRRLIVIAARGLEVELSPSRPMPKGLAIARKGGGRFSFQLFDARKRFAHARRTISTLQPRLRVIEFIQVYQPQDFGSPSAVPKLDHSIDALRLGRRLAAVKMALENLPRQAKRFKRWQARRGKMKNPKFTSPLRPGPPPGHRKMAKDDIDWVLRQCHALAWDALEENTS